MRIEQFTTESYPIHQRAQVWRDALRPHQLQAAFTSEAAPLAAPQIFGQLTSARTGRGVGLVRIASCAQTLAHAGGGAHVDRADRADRVDRGSDAIWLALHQTGRAALHDGDHAVALSPGDIVYGPAHTAARLVFDSDFRQFLVSVPAAALKSRLPDAQALLTGHLSGQAGMGRLLAGTLGALADAFDTLNDDEVSTVESSLLDYVATSLADRHDNATAAIGSTQAATYRRLCQFIEQSLSEPTLSLALVAAHENISERLVQKLFEGTGQTFTGYVRQRRLEQCRADLGSRQYGHLSISDICFRWGFNDAAHFSHAFRDRYQMSPRQYRQQANEASQQTLRKRIRRGWPSGYFETQPDVPLDARADLPPDLPSDLPSDLPPDLPPDLPTDAPAPTATPLPVIHADASATITEPPAGRHHHLPATPETIHWGYFSQTIPPVLTIDSGDIVTIETLTQHAYDDYDRMIKGDSGAERVFQWTREHKAVDRRGAGPTDASIYGRGSGEGFGVHICTGPIYVKEAEPGDVLEVRILDLAPRLTANARYARRAFGSNAATWWGFHYDDLIEAPRPRDVVTIYEVNCEPGRTCAHAVYNFRWTPQRDPSGTLHPTIDYPGVPIDRASIVENHGVLAGIEIPVRPHFGVIALAPAETGVVDSIPPSYFGGNLDNWRIAKGATVYLRVGVDGGLLSVGDPHASQGDSELCGTAIECSLTGVFQVVLHKARDLTTEPFADIDYPLVETADEWVLHGFSHANYLKDLGDQARSLVYENSSLDPAMRDAFRKTRRFLMTAMGLTEDEAISLMSVAVDFGVTQVVDGNWGVHAVVRKAMFRQRLRDRQPSP